MDIKTYTVKEILKMKFPKNQFLVDGLVPEKAVTIISGQPGSGKSWVVFQIIKDIAEKKPVFGKFEAKTGNILLIDGETGFGEISRRLKLMKFHANKKINIISDANLKMDRPNPDIHQIVKIIREKNIKLVVLDPFISFHNQDENVSSGMQIVMKNLRTVAWIGPAIILVHHHRKEFKGSPINSAQNIRGSSAILGAIDSHIEVKKEKSVDGDLILIKQNKARRGKAVEPFSLKMTENEEGVQFSFIESIAEKSKRERVKAHILQAINEQKELDFKALFKSEVGGLSLFKDVIQTLKSEKVITSRKVAKGREIFSKVQI